jgi:hypothetical protein
MCNISFTTKQRLNTHIETEKHKTVFNLYSNWNQQHNTEINKLQDKIIKLNEELKNKQELILQNIKLQDRIKNLEEKADEYRKIVEKVATKSTNTVKNYSHNNYLNYISTEPIMFQELKSQVRQLVNCETIMYNDEDFHDHIVDNILKDKSGKDKVLCTDINRKNFTYKDEKSGKLISDPELERLREQLKKGTDIRQIRKDLLEKLVNEYEENGSIGIDPYKQFSDIIQKINFGTPFVDHMAKKTYVKRCPSHKSNNSIEDNCNINEESVESVESVELIDYDEQEYQKLLKEFGENE